MIQLNIVIIIAGISLCIIHPSQRGIIGIRIKFCYRTHNKEERDRKREIEHYPYHYQRFLSDPKISASLINSACKNVHISTWFLHKNNYIKYLFFINIFVPLTITPFSLNIRCTRRNPYCIEAWQSRNISQLVNHIIFRCRIKFSTRLIQDAYHHELDSAVVVFVVLFGNLHGDCSSGEEKSTVKVSGHIYQA